MDTLPHPQDPADRRLDADRRGDPTPAFSRFSLRGRRARIRRDRDLARGRYVDRSSGRHLALILTLLILIVVDTGSTLYILRHEGGQELNPLMDRALKSGVGWFLLWKLAPLPLAFLLLSVHRYFRWVRAGLVFLLGVYGVLALYHVYLLVKVARHLGAG